MSWVTWPSIPTPCPRSWLYFVTVTCIPVPLWSYINGQAPRLVWALSHRDQAHDWSRCGLDVKREYLQLHLSVTDNDDNDGDDDGGYSEQWHVDNAGLNDAGLTWWRSTSDRHISSLGKLSLGPRLFTRSLCSDFGLFSLSFWTFTFFFLELKSWLGTWFLTLLFIVWVISLTGSKVGQTGLWQMHVPSLYREELQVSDHFEKLQLTSLLEAFWISFELFWVLIQLMV